MHLLAHGALYDTSGGFEVSASSGVVMVPADASTPAAVLHLADERLYSQKARGGRAAGRPSSPEPVMSSSFLGRWLSLFT